MKFRVRHIAMVGATTIIVAVALYLIIDPGSASVHHGSHRVPFKFYSMAEDALFARRAAFRMKDGAPKEIEVVSSTRTQALRVISPEEKVVDENSGNVAVRVFAMHGRFTDLGPVPRGEAPPKGTWLTFSVDEDTGQVLDLSLTDERPKLSALGRVHRVG